MPPPPSRTSIAVRACDSCRRRKVKCDASAICTNCQISKISCRYTLVPRKRGPKVAAQNPDVRRRRGRKALDGTADPQRYNDANEAQLPAEATPAPAPQPDCVVGSRSYRSHEQVVPSSTAPSCEAIRNCLARSISAAMPSLVLRDAVSRCVDLYIQYVFPTSPSVHESSLRAAADKSFPDVCVTNPLYTEDWQADLEHMRSFALVTALCASVASLMPASLLPYGMAIAQPLLTASRDMLKLFEDADVENPCSTSITTRILHCNALQHVTGKAALANHVLGHAILLIRTMSLHSEKALARFNSLEAQTLRLIYWQMYAADKASACLKSRAYYLHELLFEEEPTTNVCTEFQVPMLDTSNCWYEKQFEERILVGFHLIPRLWSTAANLIFEMRTYAKGDQASSKAYLTEGYMGFLGIMDGFPAWLQASRLIASGDDDDVARFRKSSFWVQRCTILVTFQCLRLVILQQCILSKIWGVMGLSDDAFTLAMTQISMVHEFLQTLDDIPFVYLQVKGEPMVRTPYSPSMSKSLTPRPLGGKNPLGWESASPNPR
ncbi:hypothetical protein PFICI_07364 [Pestalotiopsis fici W106-1]|uniref:Zn(2)-C6 fungal-type domain-containing protein n=1 Tax=Pestalotiopsis fici (strain W106-1 / CGMCC3.15140) TaxID=1229662 RepID=W3X185_PESFW|nr:uncharacterized protein PFICI_07364 [Pestalotiopsis fici W106-1]ETS79835.1 hypothetical protein PFICI_07364 [Pestalotiopsis fici W106-1]